MTFELTMLFWAAVTLFVLLAVQGSLTPLTQGLSWGLGARDEPRELSVLQGRMKRVVANHIEGMAVFAVLIMVAHLAGVSTGLTQAGAAMFLGSRILFAVVYAGGLPVVRSLVWSLGAMGLILIGYEILTAPLAG